MKRRTDDKGKGKLVPKRAMPVATLAGPPLITPHKGTINATLSDLPLGLRSAALDADELDFRGRLLRFADYFAGCGGLSTGLEQAGHVLVEWAEINPACQKVLERHFPAVAPHRRLGDVQDIKVLPKDIDMLVAGVPCIDFSHRGSRKGLEGEHGNKVTLLFDLLKASKKENGGLPEYLILENVDGIMNKIDGAPAMDYVAGQIEALGYHSWAHRIICTASFGEPHRRRRVFLLACYHGDASDILLGEGMQQCTGACQANGRPCYECYKHPDRGLAPGDLNGSSFAMDLGNAQSAPAMDVVPTFTTNAKNLCICKHNGDIGMLRIGEAERLQGMEEGYTKAPGVKEADRWRMLGNAVSIKCAAWIGWRLRLRRGKYVRSPADVFMPNDYQTPMFSKEQVRALRLADAESRTCLVTTLKKKQQCEEVWDSAEARAQELAGDEEVLVQLQQRREARAAALTHEAQQQPQQEVQEEDQEEGVSPTQSHREQRRDRQDADQGAGADACASPMEVDEQAGCCRGLAPSLVHELGTGALVTAGGVGSSDVDAAAQAQSADGAPQEPGACCNGCTDQPHPGRAAAAAASGAAGEAEQGTQPGCAGGSGMEGGGSDSDSEDKDTIVRGSGATVQAPTIWPRCAWYHSTLGRYAVRGASECPMKEPFIPLGDFVQTTGEPLSLRSLGKSLDAAAEARRLKMTEQQYIRERLNTVFNRAKEQGWDVTPAIDRLLNDTDITLSEPHTDTGRKLRFKYDAGKTGRLVWARDTTRPGHPWWPAEALDPFKLPARAYISDEQVRSLSVDECQLYLPPHMQPIRMPPPPQPPDSATGASVAVAAAPATPAARVSASVLLTTPDASCAPQCTAPLAPAVAAGAAPSTPAAGTSSPAAAGPDGDGAGGVAAAAPAVAESSPPRKLLVQFFDAGEEVTGGRRRYCWVYTNEVQDFMEATLPPWPADAVPSPTGAAAAAGGTQRKVVPVRVTGAAGGPKGAGAGKASGSGVRVLGKNAQFVPSGSSRTKQLLMGAGSSKAKQDDPAGGKKDKEDAHQQRKLYKAALVSNMKRAMAIPVQRAPLKRQAAAPRSSRRAAADVVQKLSKALERERAEAIEVARAVLEQRTAAHLAVLQHQGAKAGEVRFAPEELVVLHEAQALQQASRAAQDANEHRCGQCAACASKGARRRCLKARARAAAAWANTGAQLAVLGHKCVGALVRVWWSLDQRFYDGQVISFDAFSMSHHIVYEDGDEEDVPLWAPNQLVLVINLPARWQEEATQLYNKYEERRQPQIVQMLQQQFQPPMSCNPEIPYELERHERIQRRQAYLRSLGIAAVAVPAGLMPDSPARAITPALPAAAAAVVAPATALKEQALPGTTADAALGNSAVAAAVQPALAGHGRCADDGGGQVETGADAQAMPHTSAQPHEPVGMYPKVPLRVTMAAADVDLVPTCTATVDAGAQGPAGMTSCIQEHGSPRLPQALAHGSTALPLAPVDAFVQPDMPPSPEAPATPPAPGHQEAADASPDASLECPPPKQQARKRPAAGLGDSVPTTKRAAHPKHQGGGASKATGSRSGVQRQPQHAPKVVAVKHEVQNLGPVLAHPRRQH